jgi:acetyltransferase-like isoleucine patch superfamily enzyme
MPNEPKFLETKIASDVVFGERCKVFKSSNLYGCKVGDDCLIGPFVEIQCNAVIGNRTRVQSHAFICSLVTIGDDCFISHGVMFTNDTFGKLGRPAYTEREEWKPTYVGNRVVIGTGAVILPVRICDDVIIGAGAVVTKDITQSGIYVGNPAKYLKPLPAGYAGDIKPSSS